MIEKIYEGDYLKRLDNIVQWSEKDVFTRETVSQHSYKVTVFCRVLLQEIFGDLGDCRDSIRDFAARAVDHALFHDWDEALLLRDISHETKYNSYNGEEIRRALDNLSKYLSVRELTDHTACGTFVHGALNEQDADVLLFCKFCDWMALAFFLRRELALGNRSLLAQVETVERGLKRCGEECEKMFQRKFNVKVTVFEHFYKIQSDDEK